MVENDKRDAVSLGDVRYKCPCGYIYDPAKGDPKQNIPAGTKFEYLPDEWRCPRCKRKRKSSKSCNKETTAVPSPPPVAGELRVKTATRK